MKKFIYAISAFAVIFVFNVFDCGFDVFWGGVFEKFFRVIWDTKLAFL